MKNKLLFSVAFALLLLTACQTAEQPTNETTPNQMTTNTEVKEEPQVTNTDENSTENETHSEGEEKEEEIVAVENSIHYNQKGKEYSGETNLLDGSNYSIRVLDGYELSKEEPGKDVLLLKENADIYMRIEVFSKDETTYEDVVKNTEDLMNIYGQYESYNISEAVKEQNTIDNSIGYIATLDQDEIVGVVFEKNNILVRLTIFDFPEYDLKDAFIKMGLTIEEK